MLDLLTLCGSCWEHWALYLLSSCWIQQPLQARLGVGLPAAAVSEADYRCDERVRPPPPIFSLTHNTVKGLSSCSGRRPALCPGCRAPQRSGVLLHCMRPRLHLGCDWTCRITATPPPPLPPSSSSSLRGFLSTSSSLIITTARADSCTPAAVHTLTLGLICPGCMEGENFSHREASAQQSLRFFLLCRNVRQLLLLVLLSDFLWWWVWTSYKCSKQSSLLGGGGSVVDPDVLLLAGVSSALTSRRWLSAAIFNLKTQL